MPATGAHFRNNASRLMFLAAFLYLTDSARSDVDRWDIPRTSYQHPYPSVRSHHLDSRSRLSPLHSKSSIFFVMILVTSFKFSFN